MRVLAVFAALFLAVPAAAAPPPLIPLPVSVQWQKGSVPIGTATRIDAVGEAAATGEYLKRTLDPFKQQEAGLSSLEDAFSELEKK